MTEPDTQITVSDSPGGLSEQEYRDYIADLNQRFVQTITSDG